MLVTFPTLLATKVAHVVTCFKWLEKELDEVKKLKCWWQWLLTKGSTESSLNQLAMAFPPRTKCLIAT